MKRYTDYSPLAAQVAAMTEGIPYEVANFANAADAIWEAMEDINWAGFYKMVEGALVLYPFQGKSACIRIPVGKGVCGTAVEQDTIQLVEDVHQFPGHIACDSASNSEIVVPIFKDGAVWGVLDIDSPKLRRFTQADREGLEQLARIVESFI